MIASNNLSARQVLNTITKTEFRPEKETADTAILVQLIKSHSERGFTILYDNYSTDLYIELLKIVRRIEVAEDLLQDTFVKIWKKIEQFDSVRGTLFTWMLNIARNLAIDYLRSPACKKQLQSVNIETFILRENYPTNMHSQTNDLDYKDFKKKALQIEQKYAEVIDLICFQGYTQNET